jgi:hypothetical protein
MSESYSLPTEPEGMVATVRLGHCDLAAGCPFCPGGLNRSTQHFILKERWSVV